MDEVITIALSSCTFGLRLVQTSTEGTAGYHYSVTHMNINSLKHSNSEERVNKEQWD